MYSASPKDMGQRAMVTSLYETSDLDLKIAPGNKDPRTMKGRAAFHQELLERTIQRAEELGHDKEDFNTEQIGFLAAKSILKVDSVIDKGKRGACKVEAMRILCAMLGKNRALAQQFEATGVEVVVVPADRPMTDLDEFSTLKDVAISQESGSARTWNETRGVGGLTVTKDGNTKVYVAVTEENLLGTGVGEAVTAVGGGCYAAQYSTTSHEFAHGIHKSSAMTQQQKNTIKNCFDRKKKVRIDAANNRLIVDDRTFGVSQVSLDQLFNKEWVDGKRMKQAPAPGGKQYFVWSMALNGYVMNPPPGGGHFRYACNHELQDCYAAFDEFEYFAQCANAYLGANGGTDPYTRRPRHNGEAWIRANEEPEMVRLLDELFSAGPTNHYGMAQLENTNVEDDGVDEPTVADYIRKQVTRAKHANNPHLAMASRRRAMGYDDEDESDDWDDVTWD